MPTEPPRLDQTSPVAESRRAWLILAIVWAAFAVVILVPGNVVITSHWGDALHLVDILDRMSQGQQPHRDFVTPLGELAFSPISALMAAGMPTGRAYLTVQILLAGGLGAAGLAIALRRMPWVWALLFACAIIIITAALVHGRPESSLSINVHYNRWSWALGFVALLAALLEPVRTRSWEGVFIGAAMAALALIKVTYFVAFLPLVVLGLVVTGQIRSLITALATGAGVAVLLTILWGADYWQAYFGDLLYVAGADARPNAGGGVLRMVTGPRVLAPVALTAVAVAVLFRGGMQRKGVLLICAFLSGAYVSDQNAGFDPLFLGFVALLLLVWGRGLGDGRRIALTMISLGLGVAVAPNAFNLATSPARAALADRSGFVPLVIGSSRHQDILLERGAALSGGQTHLGFDGQRPFFGQQPLAPVEFQGEALPVCESLISPAFFASIAADLAERDLAQGQTIFVADFLSPLWLFGDHPPLIGAAPWSYGGLHGIENADVVLVPVCPNRMSVHRLILDALEETPMTELLRTPLYRLYAL